MRPEYFDMMYADKCGKCITVTGIFHGVQQREMQITDLEDDSALHTPCIVMLILQSGICGPANRALIQYKDVILLVQEIPLWKWDGRKIVLTP